MNSTLDLARERVTQQCLSADSLPEIEAAKQVLREWMRAHPEEQGMRAGFEQLYTIQEIIEQEIIKSKEAERGQPQREPVGAAG